MLLEKTDLCHPKCGAMAFAANLGVLLKVPNTDDIYSYKSFPKRIVMKCTTTLLASHCLDIQDDLNIRGLQKSKRNVTDSVICTIVAYYKSMQY